MEKFFSSFTLFILMLFYSSIEFEYQLKATITDKDLEILNFDNNICTITIPSLSLPINVAIKELSGLEYLNDRTFEMSEIIFNIKPGENTFSGYLYRNPQDNALWARDDIESDNEYCYLGLSYKFTNSCIGLESNEVNLWILNRTKKIESPIFSFDKWTELKNDSIISELYYGENHDDFISNKGIKGTCQNIEKGDYWGCLFDNIYFEDKNISLISEETKENYNIYFVSESYDIVFPLSFENEFIRITNDHCNISNSGKSFDLICDYYFENNDTMEMILGNKDMYITIEIDNLKRYKFNPKDEDKKTTRIKFKAINYIILPLIIFKRFHVQFNAENNIINFYTNDSSILQIRKKPKNDDSSSDSNGLTVFLVILIIIILIVFAFGIFYFIKKRNKSHSEGDINKFNRFEDEEGQLNSMNEKVF